MLLNPPMVNLQNTSFVLASSGSYSAIPWTAQLSKSGNITWSSGTNPSRITAVVPGTYLLTGTVIWPGGLASGDGRGQIQVNGSATDIRVTTMRGSVGNNGASRSEERRVGKEWRAGGSPYQSMTNTVGDAGSDRS